MTAAAPLDQAVAAGSAVTLSLDSVVRGVANGRFVVHTDGGDPAQRFYWEVKAVRAEVPALAVERPKQ